MALNISAIPATVSSEFLFGMVHVSFQPTHPSEQFIPNQPPYTNIIWYGMSCTVELAVLVWTPLEWVGWKPFRTPVLLLIIRKKKVKTNGSEKKLYQTSYKQKMGYDPFTLLIASD